jgi:thiosulfate/3-mercaptopyruvate sulfurtransferase
VVALVGVAAIEAAGGPWPPWAEDEIREPSYPEITTTVDELAGSLGEGGLVVVDARSPDAYRAGHLPTAVSIPALDVPDPPQSTGVLAERGLTGRDRVVCYGEGSYSAEAARLFWLLEAAGAGGASILDGGLSGWTAAGHELENEATTLPPAAWSVEPRPERVASGAYVALTFGEEGHEIIDARGWDAWEGAAREPAGRSEGARRTGHIPHALPFDFRDLVVSDGRLMPAADAREILAALGPRPSTPVDLWDEFIVYDDGASGEGAIGYFLLRRSGVETVRYYPEGWRGWGSDPDLPVVRIVHAEELEGRLASARRWLRPDAPPATFALFDVRHRHDFDRGHLPGAANLTSRFFADSLDIYLERDWPELDRSQAPIVTYCYGPNCIRSRDCATVAARKGFVNVERFYGGIEEWRANGSRLSRGP